MIYNFVKLPDKRTGVTPYADVVLALEDIAEALWPTRERTDIPADRQQKYRVSTLGNRRLFDQAGLLAEGVVFFEIFKERCLGGRSRNITAAGVERLLAKAGQGYRLSFRERYDCAETIRWLLGPLAARIKQLPPEPLPVW